MSNEIKKATGSFTQHDACDDCGKRTDGLMTCTYSHDESEIKLCPDCIKDRGFCLRCGYFWEGASGFDGNYCSDCRREIEDEFGNDDDNGGSYPCDDCDLPDVFQK